MFRDRQQQSGPASVAETENRALKKRPTFRWRPSDLVIERFFTLDAQLADTLREICTFLGVPPICPYPACRRSGRCSTAQVMCWQAGRELINPIIQDMVKRNTPPDQET
jgi:hypothetical protein